MVGTQLALRSHPRSGWIEKPPLLGKELLAEWFGLQFDLADHQVAGRDREQQATVFANFEAGVEVVIGMCWLVMLGQSGAGREQQCQTTGKLGGTARARQSAGSASACGKFVM